MFVTLLPFVSMLLLRGKFMLIAAVVGHSLSSLLKSSEVLLLGGKSRSVKLNRGEPSLHCSDVALLEVYLYLVNCTY